MIFPWKYAGDGSQSAPSYKPYKNTQFNKKLAKAKILLNSIDETSLRKEDKAKLKSEIQQMFNTNQ